MRYLVVTGIPLWEYEGHLYVDDRWAEDIKGQVGLWDSVEVFCPLKRVGVLPPSAVALPQGIGFRAYAEPKRLLVQLVSRLRSDEGTDTAYEFAGTNCIGRTGFVLAVFVGRRNAPLFITFDAPLSMILLRGGSATRRVARIMYMRILGFFRRWALKSAHGVLVVGEGILDEIDPARKYRDKCLLIPLTLFNPMSLMEPKRGLKRGERLRITCADRLASEKGVYELVQAFGKVADQLGDVELHLFGDGPLRDLIINYVRHCPFADRVFIHGSISHQELLAELRKADVMVNITKVGDINRTMWEGAAAGCALIASDLAGVRTFFKDGENALLVPPNDVDAIATALVRICREETLRTKLAISAYELAKNNTNQRTKIRRREWIQSVIDRANRAT